MIEILFSKYEGKWSGEPAGVTAFTSGAKWITDRLYTELQKQRKTNQSEKESDSSESLYATNSSAKFLSAYERAFGSSTKTSE